MYTVAMRASRTAAVKVAIGRASPDDVPAIVELRNAAAARLTELHGHGHWSSCVAERGVARDLGSNRVLVARRRGGAAVGTLTLQTKKPWAIDTAYFTPVERALYLINMAVAPAVQGRGVGRAMLAEAAAAARGWPAQAIRLDAYDAAAGAGGFYAAAGFREVGRVSYRGVPLTYFELLIGPRGAAGAG